MNILQANIFDDAGGAARIAWYLFQRCHLRGYNSFFAVGTKNSNNTNVIEIPNYASRNLWTQVWHRTEKALTKQNIRFLPRICRGLASIGEPRRWLERQWGIEDFNFSGTQLLLDLFLHRVDIFHAHVLHSGYFDLRILPQFCTRTPIILTLHDEWMMTGHCACTLGCERWKIGCGHCPDLSIYPPIKRDATAYNWRRKQKIYTDCRFYVATPSQWLMDKVQHSMLFPAIKESRVIPNGVDLSVFYPSDKNVAREKLGLPRDAWISLFVGHGTRSNKFKDYATIKKAAIQADINPGKLKNILICLGEKGGDQRVDHTLIRFVNYQSDPTKVAQYYQASDVCLHAAHSEVFGLAVLEAMACGVPVVATSVGGIPEFVEDGITGFLIPPGDSEAMASRIKQLRQDTLLYQKIANRAANSARQRFSLDMMVDKYLDWYEEILETRALIGSTKI